MVPFAGYVAMGIYAVYVTTTTSCICQNRTTHLRSSGIVIDQSRKGGFRLRTVDEIEQKRAQIEKEKIAGSDTDLDKKASAEYVESVSV